MRKILLIFIIPFFSFALPFESRNISIVGPSPYLQSVAQRIYKKGGNVVDAAVASAFALAVVTPFYVSLGSGGFALVDMKNSVEALDFREVAPQSMHPRYYEEKNRSSVEGGTAVGVPGFVFGMWSLHQKYGKLSWYNLIKDAMHLARRGHLIGTEWAQVTREVSNLKYGMSQFLNKGKPYKVGEIIKQENLFYALKRIQQDQLAGFYKGKVAQDVVDTVNQYGGSMTLKDLENYRTRWLKPIKKEFMGYTVYSMPPPSSGGIILATALSLIEKLNLKKYRLLSHDEIHLLSEIMSRSFRSRNLIADPSFQKVPIKKVLSESYLEKMKNSIHLKRARNLDPLKETTHLVVMDKEGRTVSMTLTLNLRYGSKVVTSKYGIVLNNQLDDFTTNLSKPNSFGLVQGRRNQVEAGKRPLSSTAPTIVKKNNQTVLALGGAGGPRIITGVLQVIYRTLVNGLNIDQAVQFPRVHHQFLPRKTLLEKNRFTPELIKSLRYKKHTVEEVSHLGKIYGIHRAEDKILRGAFDSRGDGTAWGL